MLVKQVSSPQICDSSLTRVKSWDSSPPCLVYSVCLVADNREVNVGNALGGYVLVNSVDRELDILYIVSQDSCRFQSMLFTRS